MVSTADMTVSPTSVFSPDALPRPAVRERELGTLAWLNTVRSDVLAVFPARVYTNRYFHRRLLGRDAFILSDPGDIDHVLNRHSDRYHRDPLTRRILEPSIARGLFLAEHEEWRRQRRSLASAFQPRHIERLIPAFHSEATRRIAGWRADGTRSRNLLADFRALTVAIAARAMFSIEDDGRTAELADLIGEAERRNTFLDWRDFLFLLFGRGIPQPAMRRDLGRRWRGWITSFLENRPPLAQLDDAGDLLDLLRGARDEAGDGFPAEVIADQVGTMMAAGFETTAVALFWIVLLLALFPDRQEAIRAELSSRGVDAPPQAQFLRSLPVTTAFVYEALRLYPPVHNLARQAAVDDRIGDLEIARGARITISPWVLHRHHRHWDHPDRFDPDRFVRDGKIIVPKTWMPFGAGPRICIGMVFATTEILTVLRILLQHYRITLPGPAPQPVGRLALLPEFEPNFDLTPLARGARV